MLRLLLLALGLYLCWRYIKRRRERQRRIIERGPRRDGRLRHDIEEADFRETEDR